MTKEKNKLLEKHIKKNPDILFIVNGNLYGMQDEKQSNMIEVANDYGSDLNYKEHKEDIKKICQYIIEKAKDYVAVYIQDDIGNGFKEDAPFTYEFLQEEINNTAKILERKGK